MLSSASCTCAAGSAGTLPLADVGAKRPGQVEPVARHHAGSRRRIRRISGRDDGLSAGEIAKGDRIDLDRGVGGHPVDTEDGSGRRLFRKVFAPDPIHRVVARHAGEVDLAVDHVLQRQPGGFDNRLDVLERLPDLRVDRVRQPAVAVACALPGDVQEIAGHDPGTVGPNGLRSWWRDDSFGHVTRRLRWSRPVCRDADRAERNGRNPDRGSLHRGPQSLRGKSPSGVRGSTRADRR